MFFFTEIYCDPLPPVEELSGNIESYLSLWRVNDRATYQCNAGYQLIGRKTLICLSTGEWSSQASRCEGVI